MNPIKCLYNVQLYMYIDYPTAHKNNIRHPIDPSLYLR